MEAVSPFQLFSTLIFALAVLHTFLTPTLYQLAHHLGEKKKCKKEQWKRYHFGSEILNLISEVEVVFGIWLIPLFIGFCLLESPRGAIAYLNSVDYTHPLYITVVILVIGSRPIITLAEWVLERIARLGGDTAAAWWLTILTAGPLLGAIIKEPAAMALSAILLSRKIYEYKPSKAFSYATLGLLFTNISVGGTLTSFASRSLFIVAAKWDWSPTYMFTNFGWKAIVGILIANALYFIVFSKEFFKGFPDKIPTFEKDEEGKRTPFWITAVHLLFLSAIAYTGEDAPLFIGLFMLFLGFYHATSFYQTPLHVKSALMVGFFFASLLIHGRLQTWWVAELLGGDSHFWVLVKSLSLSAFVDNATVIYIGSEIAEPNALIHYFIIAGAMAGGGLTVIGNAPNPVGLDVLRSHFGGAISFSRLFLAALVPTLLLAACFYFL